MNDDLNVRIVTLEPLHVAAALGFGTEPEGQAHAALLEWARARGLLDGPVLPRFFGFNNPSPSAGSPAYGYELWMVVAPGTAAEPPVSIKDFPGGLYAVARCTGVQNIAETWKRLAVWAETSPYQLAHHQWLEEHLRFHDVPFDEFVLHLYLPVK